MFVRFTVVTSIVARAVANPGGGDNSRDGGVYDGGGGECVSECEGEDISLYVSSCVCSISRWKTRRL